MRHISAIIASVVVAAFSVTAWAQPPTQQFQPYKGKPVPNFEIQDITGKKHRLSDYRGKVVLLNFWSPY
jgi:cytochrome oxidase Cu insertion factor (SCO1/SenC/PrrC family)